LKTDEGCITPSHIANQGICREFNIQVVQNTTNMSVQTKLLKPSEQNDCERVPKEIPLYKLVERHAGDGVDRVKSEEAAPSTEEGEM
jgi:hypothetical protein